MQCKERGVRSHADKRLIDKRSTPPPPPPLCPVYSTYFGTVSCVSVVFCSVLLSVESSSHTESNHWFNDQRARRRVDRRCAFDVIALYIVLYFTVFECNA